MKKKRPNIKMAIFLLIVTSLCTVFLSFVNRIYEKGVAQQQKELRMKILEYFEISFEEENFDKVFSDNVEIVKEAKDIYFIYKGEPPQAAMLISGSGLWSVIELLLVVNEKEKQIKKLEVLSQAETPGLGARIEEDTFLSQFEGLDYSENVKIVIDKKGEPGEINAVSGATKTSKSVQTIINEGLNSLHKILEEKG